LTEDRITYCSELGRVKEKSRESFLEGGTLNARTGGPYSTRTISAMRPPRDGKGGGREGENGLQRKDELFDTDDESFLKGRRVPIKTEDRRKYRKSL